MMLQNVQNIAHVVHASSTKISEPSKIRDILQTGRCLLAVSLGMEVIHILITVLMQTSEIALELIYLANYLLNYILQSRIRCSNRLNVRPCIRSNRLRNSMGSLYFPKMNP